MRLLRPTALTLLGCGSALLACSSTGGDSAHSADGGVKTGDSGHPMGDTGDSSVGRGDAHHSADSPVGAHDGGGPKGSEGGASADGGARLGPLVGAFVGVNGFIDDPAGLLPPLGNVREYHNWSWNEGNGAAGYPGYPNNQNSFILLDGSWDFDTYYAAFKAAGVFGYPVIQGSVPWLNNGAVPPVAAGASVTDPASYAAHADEMFQYAARYGSTAVATNLLQLAPGQPALTGLNTLQYIEDWNEEDAWWINSDGSPLFSPDAYAAMASADIDGNQGSMAKTLGLKNADPNIKMVMGGLAGDATSTTTWEESVVNYLQGVQTWATANRAGNFPADVLNVHYYSFGPSAAGTANPQPALSPEADHVTTRMKVVSAYRDANLPDKELWLTEFGYDTDPQSVLHAPALGSNSAEVVQGQWIIRYYLAVMAAGFDRAFLFVSRDSCSGTDTACATQFDTSGVAGVKGAETPKTSYYFIATFRSRLATFAWNGPLTSSNPGVMIGTLKDSASSKGAYVVWSPTSNATVVSNFSLPVTGATTASQVALVDQQMNGTETTLAITGGAVTLDVSETPTIVLVDSIP